jgi:hypothetical protein
MAFYYFNPSVRCFKVAIISAVKLNLSLLIEHVSQILQSIHFKLCNHEILLSCTEGMCIKLVSDVVVGVRFLEGFKYQ